MEPDELERKNQLLLSSRLNLAICHLKLGDNLSALYASCLALELDPNNDKGLYRKGLVWLSCNVLL